MQENTVTNQTSSATSFESLNNNAMTPAGALISTIFATTSLGAMAGQMYLFLQRLNQQASMETSKETFTVKKQQGSDQRWATTTPPRLC